MTAPHVHEWECGAVIFCRTCDDWEDAAYINRLERDRAALLGAALEALECLNDYDELSATLELESAIETVGAAR